MLRPRALGAALLALTLALPGVAQAKKKKRKHADPAEQSQPAEGGDKGDKPAEKAPDKPAEKASEPAKPDKAPEKAEKKGEAALDPNTPVPQLLEQAKAKYGELEYDDVIRLSKAVLEKGGEVPAEQQLEAYRLQGSALAGSDQAIDAERPFRMLLRLRGDYDLPGDTQPKILAVFRKVQAEEKELARQTRALSRESLVNKMALLGAPPNKGYGGYPVRFDFRLRDPNNAVESVLVPYRKQGSQAYSTVALRRDENGTWRGAITGDMTANEQGLKVEYYVETRDQEGSLVSLGGADKPLVLEVTPGTVVRERPPPLRPWTFWTAAGITAAAGLGTGVAALLTYQTQKDYDSYVGGTGTLDAGAIQDKANAGKRYALATNVGMGVTAAGLVASVLISRFVNWDNIPEPVKEQ